MKSTILKYLVWGICILGSQKLYAQISKIKFATPVKDSVTTTASSITFSGIVLQKPFGKLTINNRPIKIYNTGTFAVKIDSLQIGMNAIDVVYLDKSNQSQQTFLVTKTLPVKAQPTKSFAIDYVNTYPENIRWAQIGDMIQINAKATPGMQLSCNSTPLYEENKGINSLGIYKGSYIVRKEDTGKNFRLDLKLEDSIKKNSLVQQVGSPIRILTNDNLYGHTIGKLPYMNFGYGDDRLGGAKMTYLDSLIPFVVSGKIGTNYKVKLSDAQYAYIPESNFVLDSASQIPDETILSGNWRVEPRTDGDILNINLEQRRPYSSITEVNPSRLLIDIYGTVSNTNWITKLQGLKVIKNIWYEQLPNNILRVFIDLNSSQQWGYDIHYEGNNLVVFLKKGPKSNNWKDITIAIDAGHGGENLGADGLTGALEKDVTLTMALKLSKKLQALGAKVVMTRTKDTTLSMVERITQLKAASPDLLVSLHCNSAGNPFTQGNSTYYRYIGFATLSEYIHKEMLKLGLEDYGNIGSFNFALSGPTNYINALNELAFISNPEDEEKLLNPIWQDKMVQATVTGISNFLNANIPGKEPKLKRKK
ncbi:MAG: hypothetical protein DI598_14805 [Pseudopedobacter saltans]|uniref:N-acetylmuramoyl-L-alanine amidase n=1 Tax=Pseudopedobacter saltans TaxID=151895 RepID=A0A2W5GLS7_9SPHI|nr:MAG: hypothetical protein DI598_14805 [Pseudopedobacter saltans]